ncbi:MAG: hypothetical protein HGN29_12390 [Asgard group archaeon]|nr:hypothetical protein [Asgard group archaeon]
MKKEESEKSTDKPIRKYPFYPIFRFTVRCYFYVDYSTCFCTFPHSTDWVSIFNLRTGSFVENYYWIFIILGIIAFVGTVVILRFTVLKK